MQFQMNLKDEYFDKMKSGQKIYEIRLNDEKRQKLNIGDSIVFCRNGDEDDCIHTFVEDLLHFNSFANMLLFLPVAQLGFENKTRKEIEEVYHSFYPPELEQKYKVLAIKLKIM